MLFLLFSFMLDHDLQHMDYDFEYLGGFMHYSDQHTVFHT